eukprot:scaffold20120_cov34-Prasinocladus_malaysianus.AAC.1
MCPWTDSGTVLLTKTVSCAIYSEIFVLGANGTAERLMAPLLSGHAHVDVPDSLRDVQVCQRRPGRPDVPRNAPCRGVDIHRRGQHRLWPQRVDGLLPRLLGGKRPPPGNKRLATWASLLSCRRKPQAS